MIGTLNGEPHTDEPPTEDEMLYTDLEPDFDGESALETAVSRVNKATKKINITPKPKKKKK
jgi:hypothetical protein